MRPGLLADPGVDRGMGGCGGLEFKRDQRMEQVTAGSRCLSGFFSPQLKCHLLREALPDHTI